MTTQTEALTLAISRLEWFIDAYPHDIAISKEEFLHPLKKALAQPMQAHVALREALERIADPRNTHFGNDARVVAKEALDTTPPQRKPLTDGQSHQILLDMAKHIETFGDKSTTEQALSSECIRFIFEQVAAHGIKG